MQPMHLPNLRYSEIIKSVWAIGPIRPILHYRHVHIWRIFLPIEEKIKAILQDSLSSDELYRVKKFHFKPDQERALVSRGGLRNILARYLNKMPNEIVFHYTPLGKPYLNNSTLNFNLSHSNLCVLIGIRENNLIGVDVEYYKKTVDYIPIAKNFFSQHEYAALSALPFEKQPLAFYRCWTRKEAFLKAIGNGLQTPLDQFTVNFLPFEEPSIEISHTFDGPEKNRGWQLSEINPGENYIGAFASPEKYNKICLWDWRMSLLDLNDKFI
jgi:4'-phosphopantetheinyl transferase